MASLTHKASAGIIFVFFEQLGFRGISILVAFLLGQFLTPEDFGLVAMMSVFLAIANSAMDSGFMQALIRAKKAPQVDFNTAFYSNLVLGIVSYFFLYFTAPHIADFYNEPRLILLIRIASFAVIINSFKVVQTAKLHRELNFKTQMKASIPAGLISGVVAIILAYLGLGVWALITQMLLASFILTTLLWKLQGWRPTFNFSFASLKNMYSFGGKIFFSSLLHQIFQNIYVVVIAKFFSATASGYYFFVDKIKMLILHQLVNTIQSVIYPALATIQEDDARLKSGYRKVINVTTFLLFPTLLFLTALAQPMFIVFLPEKWLPAVPYLQLACFASLLYPLHAINLDILKVKGRSDLFLYLTLYKKFQIILIIFISLDFGIQGILIGQIINSLISYLPNSYYSKKLINYSIFEQIRDFLPSLLLSSFASFIAYFIIINTNFLPIINLAVGAFLSTLFYLTVAHILKFKALSLLSNLVKNRFKFKEN
jgi:O-antigen/teichoic acid export membrane protein